MVDFVFCILVVKRKERRKDDRAQETDCWARSSPGSICKNYLVLMLVRISLMIINHFIINAGLLGASEYERRVIQSL